jgi:hypothetical protein
MTIRKLTLLAVVLLFTSVVAVAQDPKQQLNDQFFEATRKGDAAAVTALLDKGADVNAKFRYGMTALFKAAERGHVDVVKVLLDRGVDVTVKDTFYGATAMTWALQNDRYEVVKLLIQKDKTNAGEVLTTGARSGNAELVKAALDTGAIKPDALTSALAMVQGDTSKAEIAELLKKAGAVPPLQLDAAALQAYAGKFKPDTAGPPEITFSVQDGKLMALPTGQRSLPMMAIDKVTFKPVGFDGIVVTFTFEGDKATGFMLKQGPANIPYKRVEEPKP